jgi:hypothetical protein
MKKIFLIVFCLISAVVFSQSYSAGHPVKSKTLTAGTYRVPVDLQKSVNGARPDWHWEIWAQYSAHKDFTKHTYMVPQELGADWSGTTTPTITWINYPGQTADSIKATAGVSEFREVYSSPCQALSLYVVVGTGDTLTLNVWYTLIK